MAPGRIELTLSHVPEYDGQGYEIVGFGWQQGWNGRVNQACNDGYVFTEINTVVNCLVKRTLVAFT